MRGLVWHGHIALWHDNGKIRLRAPSRSEVPEMEAWRGGEGRSEWGDGRGRGLRGKSKRGLKDFSHGFGCHKDRFSDILSGVNL